MKNILIVLSIFLSINCHKSYLNFKETPLITVIKLQSAENLLNFDEAKKYIDIKQVYGKYNEIKNPEEEWKNMVTFFYNLGNNKKFTNQFKYFDFNISETINLPNSIVKFRSINEKNKIEEINYYLNKLNGKWVVVDIQYKIRNE